MSSGSRWSTSALPESTKLLAAAVAASLATFTALELYRVSQNTRRRRQLKKRVADDVYGDWDRSTAESSLFEDKSASSSIIATAPSLSTHSHEQAPRHHDHPQIGRALPYDESLIREQLSRNYSFFGEEGMQRVRKGRAVVVGCGGVGSWAAVMLVRSGVSYVRLVDFDMVTLSSLNRHAVADLSDVGTPKVVACKRFFQRVAPWVEVDARQELWQPGSQGERLLDGDVDWVIDAIDNIGTKVELLKFCHRRGIKVFASMGAGAKCDPTRVQISDISNTYEDPLARAVRRGLRADGILEGIPVVYSTEIPGDVKLLPLPDEEVVKGAVHEFAPFDNFRVRILPVLGPLPSIFGLHIATYIICELAGKPILNPLATRNRRSLYDKMLRDLQAREARLAGLKETPRLPIDETDISFVFEDLNRGRSSIPPFPIPPKPVLARWDPSKPLAADNLVVLAPADAKTLDSAGGRGDAVEKWPSGATGAEAIKIVNERIEEARKWIRAVQ